MSAEPDDFVGKVVPDPANPPNAVVLEGFVGDSDAEGHVRVYGDLSLATWVDVPAEAILHSVRLPEDRSPVGGSILWIDGGATLRPPPAAPARATAADFLRGPVQADLGAAARAGAVGSALWTDGCNMPASGPACTVACGEAPIAGNAPLCAPHVLAATDFMGCSRGVECLAGQTRPPDLPPPPPTSEPRCMLTALCPPAQRAAACGYTWNPSLCGAAYTQICSPWTMACFAGGG